MEGVHGEETWSFGVHALIRVLTLPWNICVSTGARFSLSNSPFLSLDSTYRAAEG